MKRFPRVQRSDDRVLTGVAAGWAERWGVEPTAVRAAIGVLTLVGGIGALLYGAGVALSDPVAGSRRDGPAPERQPRRDLAVGTATAAVLVLARRLGLWPGDGIMVPAAGVAVGVASVWSRPTWRVGSARYRSHRWARVGQSALGIVVLAAGVISLANRTGGLGNVGRSASAIAVVVGGLAIVAAPALGRLLRALDEERSARIREDERAAMAAHLHDSVLQSLVLIQRSDDPRRMTTLARRQERELRAWLYGGAQAGEAASLHAAIQALTVEIESDHDVRVEAVVVGDQPLDEPARMLLAALREALVNAARHACVERVDVFVEVDDAETTCFIRDTGKGFDTATVPDDRRGISDSILGRVRRAGGTAIVVSSPGSGTEVELCLPRSR